jgi:hypothetical protein
VLETIAMILSALAGKHGVLPSQSVPVAPPQLGATAAAASASPVESAALSSDESSVEPEDDGLCDPTAFTDAARASVRAGALRDDGAAGASARPGGDESDDANLARGRDVNPAPLVNGKQCDASPSKRSRTQPDKFDPEKHGQSDAEVLRSVCCIVV